jgi:uncharacterized protein YjaZ
MAIIQTDKWLKDYEKPLKICEKLTRFFHDTPASAIYNHLIQYGMYQKPTGGGERIQKLLDSNVWEIVQTEEEKLKESWGGPDVPIFIFPSEARNKQLYREYNGKSGLTFKDKLFLFVSDHHSKEEIQALFTHEYNHVCRLVTIDKQEKDFILLDHIILEGLAENAVRERLGEEHTANWTSFYSERQLERLWKSLILPHYQLQPSHPKHAQILYGFKLYPKMAGYCVGYYLVKNYMTENDVSIHETLSLPSEQIAGIS